MRLILSLFLVTLAGCASTTERLPIDTEQKGPFPGSNVVYVEGVTMDEAADRLVTDGWTIETLTARSFTTEWRAIDDYETQITVFKVKGGLGFQGMVRAPVTVVVTQIIENVGETDDVTKKAWKAILKQVRLVGKPVKYARR